MLKRFVIAGLQIAVLAALSSLALAQTRDAVVVVAKPLTDSDIALLRQDVQAQKTDLITKSMQFSDTEAAAFWPLYKNYASEQKQIGDLKLALIQDYAANYDSMTDAKAGELSRKMLDIEKRTNDLRIKYLPLFEKALNQKRAAKFLQVDRRLSLMIDLQLVSIIPVLN